MEKKQWQVPEINELGIESTEHGSKETEDHDMTTYDEKGEWWAGGKS